MFEPTSDSQTRTSVGRTVLLVEDDEMTARMAAETLQVAGHRVSAVQDGEQAWAALEQVRPDIIVSDVRMPRCDGFELLQRIRHDARFRQTPVVMVSGKGDPADRRTGMALGADDYLVKPYRVEDLLNTLEARMSRVEAVRETLRRQQVFLTRVLPHELRTPLACVLGYAELMVRAGEAGETMPTRSLREIGHSLTRSGERLRRIAEDLSLWAWLEAQALSRGRDGPVAETRLEILPHRLLRVMEECGAEHGRTGEVVADLEADLVRAPAIGFDRVVRHLVDNGLKFSGKGTYVLVTGRVSEASYELAVTDRGRGMSAEQIAQFGAFRQFDRELYEQQGFGLGLALAAEYARLVGGDLRICQPGDGPGITVTLVLPRVSR